MTVSASIVHSADRLARIALRVPLTALDQRVVLPTLGSASPVHRVLTAAVGLLNTGSTAPDGGEDRPAADHPSPDDRPTDPEIPDRPAEVVEPVEEPPTAEQPAEEFAPVETAAMETLADDLIRDQQDERFVGELADDELRRVQAEIRAKQILEDPDHT